MKRFNFITVLLLAVLPVLSCAEEYQNSSVTCGIMESEHKIIQCTFVTDRSNEDRTIVFSWHSTATPQDDRERTIVLKAGHGSVYDYRYYYGRALGEWEVSVKDSDDMLLSSTTLNLP